jgi:hypothetical protein
MQHSLSRRTDAAQLVREFKNFFTLKFHLDVYKGLLVAKLMQSTSSYSNSERSILKLSSRSLLAFLRDFFPSCFSTKSLCVFLFYFKESCSY